MAGLVFTEPLYGLLLIPVVIGLVVSYRHVHGIARVRKGLAFGVRFLLACLLVGALAGPQSRQPNQGTATIFLLDRSDSMNEEARRQAESFVRSSLTKLTGRDAAGVVVFGKDAMVESSPAGRRDLAPIAGTVNGSSSDLASAIRLATASFPDGKARRIVLLSDGNETHGDALGAAQVAATDGIPIDFVAPMERNKSGEATVTGMEIPDEARKDQPFDLHVLIESSVAQSARLQIDRDGALIKEIPVQLRTGPNRIVVSEKLTDVGFHRFRATLVPSRDQDARNNVGMGFVAVRGKANVLVLQPPSARASLTTALRSHGIDVEVGGAERIPSRPEGMQRYDAVVLNDFNAMYLTSGQMRLIQSAVRDSGLGFAMIGGENSFLPGGYYGTPIAETLPVDLNIRQRKSYAAASVLIVIDCSGSMSATENGVVKLRLAAKAAEETVKMMSPNDRVGVAGSTDGIEFVAPMQPLTDKGQVINQIRKIDITGGGIYIGPSVIAAEPVIRKEVSKVRHLIIMGDGDDSTDFRDAFQRVALMRLDKITTSVIAIGNGKDVADLRRLAAVGGGRFYLAKLASQLPALVTQDTAVMARSAIEEGAFLPKVVAGEDALKGLDAVPPLFAYCLTDSRPLARIGMRTAKDDPLLATWQYGLGTSLAFTSDAQPRWASQWVGWSGFGAFWSQAVRGISRRATRNDYQVSVKNEGGKGRIEVRAFDRLGNPANTQNAKVRVSTPNGTPRDVALNQEAPGMYSGEFETGEIGSYIVTVAEPDPAGGQRVSSSGFSIPYPPEYRSFRPNRPLLERIASTTGGKLVTTPEEALRPVTNAGESIQELWATFLLLGALLLPLDIAVRRIALPFHEMSEKLRQWLAQRRHFARQPVAQQATVTQLQSAKARVQQQTAAPTEKVPPGASRGPSEPVTKAPSSGQAAGTSLLERKRRRKGEDDSI